MSSLHSNKEQAILSDLDKLVTQDKFSFELLDSMSGYAGPNTIRNIVRQGQHRLYCSPFSILLTELSNRQNLRMHRHVLNPRYYQIVPRMGVEDTKGTFSDLFREVSERFYKAEDDLMAGNTDALHEFYRFMQKVTSRIQAEIAESDIKLRVS